MTPILFAATALYQALGGEFIDEGHHAAWEHTELGREILLIEGRLAGDEPQDAGVRRCQSEDGDALTKAVGRVGSELGEKKGHAARL